MRYHLLWNSDWLIIYRPKRQTENLPMPFYMSASVCSYLIESLEIECGDSVSIISNNCFIPNAIDSKIPQRNSSDFVLEVIPIKPAVADGSFIGA